VVKILFIFSISIKHLWQLETVVFQHRCIIRAVLQCVHRAADKLLRYIKEGIRTSGVSSGDSGLSIAAMI
jgi:hypothetical protein